MIATPQIRRGALRLWVVATAVWEVGFAWYLIFLPSKFNDYLRWEWFGLRRILIVDIAMILAPPLAVLALGRALLWAAAGFSTGPRE